METVGLIGVGKIGLPIAENLIKSGYRVLGYRRGSLDEFQQIGGIAARSPADIGAQADVVLTCLPSAEALDDVVQGNAGLVHSARPGQIVVELGSHLVPDKERQIAPLAAKGAVFLEAFLSDPVHAERRAFALHQIPRGEVVHDQIAGDHIERFCFGDIAGLFADHDAELGLPVDLL